MSFAGTKSLSPLFFLFCAVCPLLLTRGVFVKPFFCAADVFSLRGQFFSTLSEKPRRGKRPAYNGQPAA